MPHTIVVLTEETLGSADAARIVALHADEADVVYRVLVPADTERNLLADVLDHLSLFELRAALDAVRERKPDAAEARADAGAALRGSIDSMVAVEATVTGEITPDDPLPRLGELVAEEDVQEVVVVTRPHAVEDTFHTDWASRARDELGVPVLHVYAGTTRLG